MPAKLRLVGSTPVTENGTKRKMPNRRENDRLRGRFHLTEAEVRLLKETALRDNLYGLRDATMISLAFRSCLRINELLGKQALQWSDINCIKVISARQKGVVRGRPIFEK